MRELTAATVMAQPTATVLPGTPYADAVAALARSRAGVAAVVDIAGTLLGVVSEVDSSAGSRWWFARRARKGRNRGATALSSPDLAISPAPTVRVDDPLDLVERRLVEAGVPVLFVVDHRGVLVGVVRRSDLPAVGRGMSTP
ncbi:CBS domain-containing protein [Actinokineospora sp. HUAS TT18]|uniref:CBS domain-containing protein n=1 Tax=Actinokineospora sp. HUAS TT18 TaxID=3447451 RepID=UPI003F51D0FF